MLMCVTVGAISVRLIPMDSLYPAYSPLIRISHDTENKLFKYSIFIDTKYTRL